MSFIIGTTISPNPRTGLAAAKTIDGHVDFALIPDSFDSIDALEFSSWLGPSTSELGLVPEVRITHAEPFHIATASATLDYTARGRAGLALGISTTEAEATLFGRRPAAPAADGWEEAGEVIGLLRSLWDSWDDDAIIRDTSTNRYIDRKRLHYVNVSIRDSVSAQYSVLGPSITPRPPQGHPPIVVTANAENPGAVAAADVVVVDVEGQPGLAGISALLSPDVPVIAQIAAKLDADVDEVRDHALELQRRGVSGILFRATQDSQIEFSIRLVSEIVPALISAGLREPATRGDHLRTCLSLPAATSVFAHA